MIAIDHQTRAGSVRGRIPARTVRKAIRVDFDSEKVLAIRVAGRYVKQSLSLSSFPAVARGVAPAGSLPASRREPGLVRERKRRHETEP